MSTYAPYTYTNAEGGTEFTIPFDYIDDSHLSVYVNDVLKTLKKDYWIDRNNNKIVFRSATTAGHPVRIERSTPETIRFRDGSPLTQQQFNNLIKEDLLFFQEQQLLKTEGNLLCRNNLSDVADSSTARSNLGVYSATEISSKADLYLENVNNLSDLHDVPTARINLDIYSKGETSDLIDSYLPGWIAEATIEPLTGVDQRFKRMQCQLVNTDFETVTLNPYQGDYVVVGETVRQLTPVTNTTTGLTENTIYYVYLNYESGFNLIYSDNAPNTTYCGIQGRGSGASFTPVVGVFLGGSLGHHSDQFFSWYNAKAVITKAGTTTSVTYGDAEPKLGASLPNILVPGGFSYYVHLYTSMAIGSSTGHETLDGDIKITGDITLTKQYGKWNHYPLYLGWSDSVEIKGSVSENKVITVSNWVYGPTFNDVVPGPYVGYEVNGTVNSTSVLTVIVSP